MTRVKLHGRVHLASDDKVTTSKFVKCPEDERWVPLEACKRCEKSTCVDDESVSCEPMKDASVTSRAPESAPITEVMDANVLSVDSRATIDAARRAMDDQGASIAIVVDAGRHAIGVCSRVDIVRRAPNHRVEACMTPFVITLLDQTTVADALDLVVERDLHHVPVRSEGRIVGIVTPRAIIRWLAQELREARSSRVRTRSPRPKA